MWGVVWKASRGGTWYLTWPGLGAVYSKQQVCMWSPSSEALGVTRGTPSLSEGLQPSRSQEWPAVSSEATYLTGALTSPGTMHMQVFFSGYPQVWEDQAKLEISFEGESPWILSLWPALLRVAPQTRANTCLLACHHPESREDMATDARAHSPWVWKRPKDSWSSNADPDYGTGSWNTLKPIPNQFTFLFIEHFLKTQQTRQKVDLRPGIPFLTLRRQQKEETP